MNADTMHLISLTTILLWLLRRAEKNVGTLCSDQACV